MTRFDQSKNGDHYTSRLGNRLKIKRAQKLQQGPGRTRGELPHSKLGAEKDGFALEHFDGEKEGNGSVGAGRAENDGDQVPMVGPGD